MNTSTQLGLRVLAAAAALGLLGDMLLRADGVGLNGFLWIAATVGALQVAAWRGGVELKGNGRWLALPAVLFAGFAAWRDSPVLLFLDFVALCAALGLTVRYTKGGDVREGGIFEHGLGLALAGVWAAISPFFLVGSDIKWPEVPRGKWTGQTAAVVRGLLIAVPLLLIFGGLFMAADAVFAQMANRMVTFDTGVLLGHIFSFLIWGALAAGFLRAALVADLPQLPAMEHPVGLRLGQIEQGVVLGLLNALFLAFVLVQFRYLFGGAEHVMATTGLTYAEYARQGFFQLVGVSALVLPLLLGLHWLLPEDGQHLFRWLAGALVVQLFVIIASAMQRMLIYQNQYGLTEQRLYVTAFMIWLAVLFLWFGATVMRGRRSRFVFGAVMSGFAVLVALHVLNPDALIARTNIARMEQGKPFDADYAATLSADAVPLLVNALPQMPPEQQKVVSEQLLQRWGAPRQDWRSWNWSRSQAVQAVDSLHHAMEAWAGN